MGLSAFGGWAGSQLTGTEEEGFLGSGAAQGLGGALEGHLLRTGTLRGAVNGLTSAGASAVVYIGTFNICTECIGLPEQEADVWATANTMTSLSTGGVWSMVHAISAKEISPQTSLQKCVTDP
jgi:hypothetical protein